MAYAHHKVDPKLVETPVDGLCGDPKDRKDGGAATYGGWDVPGGHKDSGGVIETVTTFDGLEITKD